MGIMIFIPIGLKINPNKATNKLKDMKLTGKCKEDFEKWLKINYTLKQSLIFNSLPDSMQFGVYVDFFDSVWIEIWIEPWETQNNGEFFKYFKVIIDYIEVSDYNDSRQEARTKAIEKANEIYNQTNQ